MRVGLVGFRGSGKSILFDALTRGRSAKGSGPGSGRIATVVHHADDRLRGICDLLSPKKRTPLSFELHDYPGFPPPGCGDEDSATGAVRDDTDGLVLAVRGFTTDAYYYPEAAADPSRDARDLVLLLLLLDLEVVTRAVEKLEVSVRKGTPRREVERLRLGILERVRAALESETPVKEMAFSADEERTVRSFGLLTQKPWVLLVSLGDEGGEGVAEQIPGPFEDRLEVRVKLESELLEFPDEERVEFMEDLSIRELLLPGLLERVLPGMGMIRFYTANDREAHVWELRRGSDAVTAAGKIHSDIARGFIRAEVVACDDLFEAGSMAAARGAGKVRLEGRDYIVKEGDLLDIRFSV